MTLDDFQAMARVVLVVTGWAGGVAEAQAPSKPTGVGVEAKGPELQGQIIDEQGRPLEGAKVTLFGGFATRWKIDEAKTDADGKYRFETVRGSMTLDEAANRWDQYVGVRVEHPTHVEADGHSWRDVQIMGTPEHVETLHLKMTLGGHLEATLKDARTGQPIKNLDLRIMFPIGTRGHGSTFHAYATTDNAGRFRSDSLFPGEYDVDVNSGIMRYPMIGRVKIEPGKTLSVSFDSVNLPKLIEGRVLDEKGRLLFDVDVTLLEPKDENVEIRGKGDFRKVESDSSARTTSWQDRFQLAVLPGLERSRFVLAMHEELGWVRVSLESLEKGEPIRLKPWKR